MKNTKRHIIVSSIISSLLVSGLLFMYVQSTLIESTKNNQPTKCSAPSIEKENSTFSNNGINIDSLIRNARKFIGTPYKPGGLGFDGIDCSGLIHQIFAQLHYKVPRSSIELSKHGMPIYEKAKLQEGDLLFFHTSADSSVVINHTGLYIGNGYFIHATTSLGTIISSINDQPYNAEFIRGTRILLPYPSLQLASRQRLLIIQNQ